MRLLAEFLTAAGLLVLLGVAVWVVLSRIKNGIEKGSEQVEEDRRDRAAYEAEIAKVEHDRLSAKDEAEVAELRAFVEEIGTGEFPALAFYADPLGAQIPDDHADFVAPALFDAVFAERLSAFVWTSDPAPSVPLSSVQVPDVEPLELESFTGTWRAADVARMVAEAKAAAR